MRKPRWMRNHIACPDCGHIYPEPSDIASASVFDTKRNPIAINCPVCKCHYTTLDFWKENEEKWDRTMKESL